MKKGLLSIVAMAVLMLVTSIGYAQTTFTKVTSASGLEEGAQYIIVGYDEALGFCAMSYQKTNNRHAVSVSDEGGSITATLATDPNNQTDVFQFTLGGGDNAWTFFDELKNGYLYAASSSSNQLKTQTNLDANGQWAIEFDADGYATVTAQGDNTRNIMRFNENSSNGTPLFACYNSGSSINVPVMLYKAGGVPAQPDPEPSNYPTNFTARVDGLDITLVWNDATGAQLPHKYLVLCSKENSFQIPVDGTPVANGEFAANVSYGVQTVTFSGLQGNTNYYFAIFPYTNSGANIDYKTDGYYPKADATTEAISTLFFEGFDSDLGGFTTYSVTGDQEWHQATYQGTNYADMNGYASGVAYANEDWLISPEILVPSGVDYEAIYLEFRNAVKYDGNQLQVFVSTDYYGGAPSDANWTELTDAFDFSTGDFTWVESGQVNIKNTIGNSGSFNVAFLYTSTDEAAAHWEVDWVEVTAVEVVSVNEHEATAFDVYPNPAHEEVAFNLEDDAQVSLYDMTGRMVGTMNLAAGEARYNVADLESGVYFLNVRYTDGKVAVTRFVKF